MPLHSSLGNNSETPSQKKKKKSGSKMVNHVTGEKDWEYVGERGLQTLQVSVGEEVFIVMTAKMTFWKNLGSRS